MPRLEVALQTGRPVVYEFVRKEPVEVARVVRVVAPVRPPYTRLPSETLVRPVPPLVVSRVPETVGVKRSAEAEGTIEVPKVRPP